MGGGGAGMLARLGGRQLLSNGARVTTRLTTRLGAQAMKNLVSSGVKNMVINTSTQLIFNGGRVNELDMADIAISGLPKILQLQQQQEVLLILMEVVIFQLVFQIQAKV
ncbi:MAG: hypothetical protein HWD62_02700 [Cyclobacteriaceae bacterium]|nr:MAG: hypothetical protein HWD62_02700 [Cyclobacteriaceae bacterium]